MKSEECKFPAVAWWRGLLWRLVGFALLWGVLTGDVGGGWLAGGLAVMTAALVSLAIRPLLPWRVRLFGVLRFLPFFCRQSLFGGIDVAQRAFAPGMRLNPVLLEYPLALPPGTARIFLLNTVSLLPGTLSADLRGDHLIVHGLDGGLPLARNLRRLEVRVADLFGLWEGAGDG